MARVLEGEQRPRWALFLRSQAPLAAAVLILLLVAAAFGVDLSAHLGSLVLATGILGATTLAALVVPWERLPTRSQGIMAVLDLVGVTVLAAALHDDIPTASMLAAFPVIWLAVIGGFVGAGVGIVAGYIAAIVPLMYAHTPPSPAAWTSALLPPVIVSVLAGVAVILVRRIQRSNERTRQAMEQRNAAAAESERIGAVMRSFSDEIDLGMVFLDADGAPPMFNKPIVAFGEMAHYDDLSGGGRLVFEDDQVTPMPADQQPVARLRRGEAVQDLLHWVGPRGRQRALLANGRIVHRSDGRVAGSMLIVQDITDPLRAERTREDALATLAHELRTPLTSIVGYAELLSADPLPPAASTRVDVIARNAEHLLAMTSAFLDGLHRPPEVQRVQVAVRELIEETLDVLLTTPGFAEREVSVEVTDDLAVVADPGGLRTVLNSLLHNAAKFSRAGDTIRISADVDGDTAWLTVRNSGSVIDAEDLERIFDRFYRGRNAQRDAVPGTGIGLSVSREIMVAHGGTLTAEPADDGACFRLTLPA
ncbi:sensor histidine kinase [Microbacterium sp. RD1]|uniref:sensor histidine kinase n=1 Tax=Microbacterium sp. RD1 TaxID=3457313 RepID=UPI003FA5CB9F